MSICRLLHLSLFSLCTFFAASLFADIYQCNVEGEMVFSDKPCADDATVITIKTEDNKIQSNNTVSSPPKIPDKPSIELKKSKGGGRVVARPVPEAKD